MRDAILSSFLITITRVCHLQAVLRPQHGTCGARDAILMVLMRQQELAF
jgi:hypothetical protein